MASKPALEWHDDHGVPYLTDPGSAALGLGLAFTSRLGGASAPPFDSLNLSTAVGDAPDAVTSNRAAVAAAVGVPAGSIAVAKQVHGAVLLEAEWSSAGPIGEGDAVATATPGLAVGVLSADCVPILLAGSTKVAAVHAGWRGLVAGAIEAAVAAIGDVDSAWVGPSIHACCYEVGPEVVAAFRERSLPVAATDRVDPGRAAISALRAAGVARIASTVECTSCDQRFFSHRRDGLTGRQGGFIAWV